MKKNILIYVHYPEGTTKTCVEEVQRALQRCVTADGYKIEKVSGQYLREMNWQQEAALLIIPGGRASINYENIGRDGHLKIIEFVKSGGSYLGICAGGYYGASKTIFEKGGPLEVLDSGPLYFYPGIAEGPVYGLGKFRYQSEAGAQLAMINLSLRSGECEHIPMYYNGGCYFHGVVDEPDLVVLGRFADAPEMPAAIIECRVGQGRAILSGVHFEFSDQAKNLRGPEMQTFRDILHDTQKLRDRIFIELLDRLLSKMLGAVI